MKISYFIGKENFICIDSLKNVRKSLKKLGKEMKEWTPEEQVDLVMVFGGDGALLQALQKMKDTPVPVLGINCGELGFMMEVSHANYEKFLPPLLRGEYKIEKRDRLKIKGKKTMYALNEVVIAPSESATLMRYTLRINGESMWRDSADGLVVSTPTGSTAYALSAGGPIIAPEAKVFEIVPNNSVNQARRSLVLPHNAKVEVEIVESPVDCQIILDGKDRFKCGERINITMSDKPALFVRMFPSYSALSSKIKKKVDVFENHIVRGESPSSKFILKIIEFEGPLTQKEIIKATQLPARTVRRNLENLIKKGVIVKKPFLEDPRQSLYLIAD
ncbi:NAD(+)/NADH kinase [archaeon]|nr:NAD(+)/NADH kinase [archaeon]